MAPASKQLAAANVRRANHNEMERRVAGNDSSMPRKLSKKNDSENGEFRKRYRSNRGTKYPLNFELYFIHLRESTIIFDGLFPKRLNVDPGFGSTGSPGPPGPDSSMIRPNVRNTMTVKRRHTCDFFMVGSVYPYKREWRMSENIHE